MSDDRNQIIDQSFSRSAAGRVKPAGEQTSIGRQGEEEAGDGRVAALRGELEEVRIAAALPGRVENYRKRVARQMERSVAVPMGLMREPLPVWVRASGD